MPEETAQKPCSIGAMNISEAAAFLEKQLLPAHGESSPTLLGSLRPYRGTLPHNVFHKTIEAIRTLSPMLSGHGPLDRGVVSTLWSLCHLMRCWGLDPQGMLQRNDLLAAREVSTLRRWQYAMSDAVCVLLDSGDVDAAFESYELYLRDLLHAGDAAAFEVLRCRMRAARSAGTITVSVVPSSPELRPFNRADAAMVANKLRPLGEAWVNLSHEAALQLVIDTIARDLAYDRENCDLATASRLAGGLLPVESETVVYLSNGGWAERRRGHSASWIPASASTFDTGVVCVCTDHVRVYWVEDED